MANKIILKKTSEAAKVPQASVIDAGELAINLTDKVLYSKDTANTVFLVKADPLYNTGLQDNLDAKVDISGDTMTGDLVVQGTVTVDHLQLNTSANNTIGIGEVFWNTTERTYNLGLGNDVVGQGFQEIYHPLVKNNTANTISNGTVVGVTGVDSGHVTVAPYISDGSFSHPTRYWGVATEDITSGSTGFITHFGKVRGIDTSAWSVGNILYASDSVAGMLTNIMPETPSDIVVVGIVTEVSTEGVIEVRHEFSSRASDIPYSNTDSTIIASNVQSALDELDLKKASIDMLTSSINLYPTSAAGDFGYYRMVSDVDDPDYNDTAYEFQTGYITTTNQYITGLIADANLFVGNPGVISITTVGNIAKTTGYSNDYAEFFFRLYKRDSGGTETLLLTSSTTGAVNGDINDYRQFSASGLLNDGTFSETDRLVLKIYANMLDDNDSRYKFQFGGTNPVRTLLPVPISVIPSYHADSILVDTSNFASILGETDDDVQTALENIDLKAAPLASPTFTGIPVAPTASSGTNTTQLATTAYVSTAIANLVETAPTTLDTLNELAAALGDDPNFSNTIVTLIGTKVDKINITGATKGSSTKIPVITYNAQGQITSASESDITVGNGSVTIQGSNGLSGSGSFTLNQGTNATVTLTHTDTSSQASVNNSGRTYIQDVTLDEYGHVTSLSSATETVVDTNTTYTINAGDVTTNEYKINLAGSDSTNDYISLKGGTNVTLTRNVDQIIISSTDTNTTYSAGSGLTLTGTSFSHTDTSSQASLTALTGANVVSDIDLDTYGHVTLMATRTMTLADLGYTGATNANYFTYTLPVATSSVLGGVKSGTDITIDGSGNVSVNDDSHNHVISNVDGLQTALDGKAPLASPTFTGTVSLPATTTLNSIVIGDATNYFQKPSIYSSLFTKVSAASISIPTGFKCLVNNVIVATTSTVTLSLDSNLDTGSKVAGTDYYVYALDSNSFIISANASYPSGYTANNSRKIGGFHYGVIPESFTAINNITSADATAIAGINTYSFWDLKYRPASSPEGMHKVGNKWYDIYLLNSEHIVNGTSKAGAIIAAGATDYGRAYPKIPLAFGGNGTTTYGSFTWFEAAEIANAYGKDLISYKEFTGLAYGVQEAASWGNSSATIQHVANHTSKWGTCQATGVEWIWSADVQGIGSDGWKTGLTEGRGDIYAYTNQPTAARLGGHWNDGSHSGSRCSVWNHFVWYSDWYIGCRFRSDHLMLV